MNELPKETAFQPAPYIALLGLDAANNTSHTAIWNAFAINRAADRPQLYYKLLPFDYTFPVAKAKKTYERYIPSGIIKTGWLAKHLFEIPSVAVVFEEAVNWETLAVNSEARNRCIERVNAVRNSLTGRQTRIVLVLLLQATSSPLTDDSAHKEIAAKLCADCDVHSKSLFSISMSDGGLIPGYVQRIEQVILDLAKNYYIAQAKSVKGHKDQLNKSSQIYLYIRHEFKLAFFNEIRLINNTALGHYKNAYASLMEIRASPLNIFEIKGIASLLNYKICRLAFYLNIPMDAISHFRKHIEIFQNRSPSSPTIAFEHHAWLSDQFLIFAELFEMAISTFNLAPSSSQHPGVYFFDASTHMIERRKAAFSGAFNRNELQASVAPEEAAILGEIVNCGKREFIGQFSFKHDLPLEADRIKLAYRALQYRELTVDHTNLLINLYVNVLNQIRKFKKPRFTRHLMYLIGREYHGSGRHEDALTYFNNILSFYREERWSALYFEIVQLALASAYAVADHGTFIRLTFETMATASQATEEEKVELMRTALATLSLQWRQMEVELRSICKTTSPEVLGSKWTEVLGSLAQKMPLPDISIAMDAAIGDFLVAKVAFSSPAYYIAASEEGKVAVKVALFSALPLDLEKRFSLQLRFNAPYYDQFCMLAAEDEAAIDRLKANSMAIYSFEFAPLLEDVGKELRVTGLTLQSVEPGQQNVSFHWTLNRKSLSAVDQLPALCTTVNERSPFIKFQQLLSTTIYEHSSKLEVEVVEPPKSVFLDEHFPVSFRFTSGEAVPLSKLGLTVKLFVGDDQQVPLEPFYYNVFSVEGEGGLLRPMEQESKLQLVELLQPAGTAESTIVLKVVAGAAAKLVECEGRFTVGCTFTYDLLLEGEKKKTQVQFVAAQKVILLSLTAVTPFAFICRLANLGGNADKAFEQTTVTNTSIRVAEPFKLHIEVGQTPSNGSEVEGEKEEESDIEVTSLTPLLTPNITFVEASVGEENKANQFPVSLGQNSPLKQTYELVAEAESPVATSLGACTLQWRRRRRKDVKVPKSDGRSMLSLESSLPANESTYSLPATIVSPSLVFIELMLPPAVNSRAAFTAHYRIHNRLDVDLSAEITMGTSDCFMVSGNKLIKVCIGAKLFIEQSYIFLPLLCGTLSLPQLGVTVHLPGAQNAVHLDHVAQMMPSSVKVLPQIRV